MTQSPANGRERAVMPDLLRAFALLGIAVVNVVGFAQPFTAGFHAGGLETFPDRVAYGGISALFLMKSYPLFSMMFGAGLSYQMDAASRAGVGFSPRYFRRMAALVVLGLLHFVFFWIGDILLTYGLLGGLLYFLRNARAKHLVRTGIALIALNAALLAALAGMMWVTEHSETPSSAASGYAQMEVAAVTAFADGNFAEAARYRLSLLQTLLPSVIFQQGLSVFGFFCFGLAAVKSGVIDRPDAPIWQLSRRVFLPVGLAGSVLGAAVLLQATSAVDSTFILGNAIIMGFAGFAAMGYAGLIALLCRSEPGPVVRFFARAGSASLTAYLLQSALFSLIFSAYGAGLFGKLGAADAVLVAVGVAAASLAFSGVWRGFAKRGPVEVLLRGVTYWGRA